MSEKLYALLTTLKNQEVAVTIIVANGFQMRSIIADFAEDYVKLASGEIVLLSNILTIKHTNMQR